MCDTKRWTPAAQGFNMKPTVVARTLQYNEQCTDSTALQYYFSKSDE